LRVLEADGTPIADRDVRLTAEPAFPWTTSVATDTRGEVAFDAALGLQLTVRTWPASLATYWQRVGRAGGKTERVAELEKHVITIGTVDPKAGAPGEREMLIELRLPGK
jgi:hypothetical protein